MSSANNGFLNFDILFIFCQFFLEKSTKNAWVTPCDVISEYLTYCNVRLITTDLKTLYWTK